MGRPGERKDKISMVVVMGVTGAGKSHFINKLAGPGKEVTKEGDSLQSCTQQCLPIPLTIGGTTVLMIDTPGFDEAGRSDSEILGEIARILVAQHKLGVELKGIVYIHRINDIRFHGGAVKTLDIFQRICGDTSLRNVLMVTSRWSEVSEEQGSRREGELREKFWSHMLMKGSNMSRFHGDRDSALMLISQLLGKKPVILQMQQELINDGKELRDTTAGSYLYNDLESLKRDHQLALASLNKLKQETSDGTRHMKWIQTDLADKEHSLQKTHEEQVELNRRIVDEVDEEMTRQSRRRRFLRVLPLMVPFLTIVLDVLFGLLGIPTGITSLV